MRILVVTDKYPPQMVGGAELSLHVLLKILRPRLSGLLVAVLDGAAASLKSHEGIDLARLPALGDWPPAKRETLHARGVGPARLTRPLGRYETMGRYVMMNGALQAGRTISRILKVREIVRSQGVEFLPSLDDDLIRHGHTVAALSALIAEFKPDLIHADNYRSILSAAAAERRGTPFTAMVRDHRFFCAHNEQKSNIGGQTCTACEFECVDIEKPEARKAAKILMSEIRDFRLSHLAQASEIVTTSKHLQSQIGAILPSAKTRAIGNPSDAAADVDRIRERISRASPPEILIVGMLNENKGQAGVISWIKALRGQLGDFRFVLAGQGRLSAQLQDEAKEAGIGDHLILTGFLDRDAIYRAYARASVVIAPNRWPEPFGRVPLEAAIAERPVVAYDVGGIGESIVDGETGRLVPPQDEAQLLDAVVELINDPRKAVDMGRRARAHILSRYDPERIASRLFEAWRENLARADAADG